MSGERQASASRIASNGREQSLDTAAFWVLACVLAAAMLLWLAGEVAARLFEGTWPGTRVSAMPGVLVRFREHVSDPAAAWPVPQREAIPGPAAFYATLAVVFAAVASVVLLVVRHRACPAVEREA